MKRSILTRTIQDLSSGMSSSTFQLNDGVVNTLSMRGSKDAYIKPAAVFAIQSLVSAASALPAKGMYWHFGTNKTMGHGDQIGVFTVGQTVRFLAWVILV